MNFRPAFRNLLVAAWVAAAAATSPTPPAFAQSPSAVPADCTDMASETLPVAFCLDSEGWALADIGSSAEMEFSTLDQQLYLMVITEPDYFDVETLRKAVLTNAQLAAKLKKIEIFQDETVDVNGHSFGHLSYGAEVDGVKANYRNYFTGIEGKGSVQFVMFTMEQPIDAFADRIAEVVASIRIND